jgi:hypothetical protein
MGASGELKMCELSTSEMQSHFITLLRKQKTLLWINLNCNSSCWQALAVKLKPFQILWGNPHAFACLCHQKFKTKSMQFLEITCLWSYHISYSHVITLCNLNECNTYFYPSNICRNGFRFSSDAETTMGLVQHEGGPCGVLATVQVHLPCFI